MKKIFEKEYDLRTSDFDKFDNIKISSVLDLFQDSAGRHAEKIGAGFLEMKKRSYFWVLVKIKFQIVKKPLFHQRVVLKTWPLKPNRFIYRREYLIKDEKGDVLIAGSSEWVVLDEKNRRLVSNSNLYSIDEDFCDEMNFEKKLEKIADFEVKTAPYVVVPGFSQVDANNHVNNTKYANFVTDAIPHENEKDLDMFQIDYRKEVLQGERLNIYYERNDDFVIAKGLKDNQDTSFACKITYKQ